MKDQLFITLKKQLPGLRRNISLARHTTFKVGGRAKYFFATDKKEYILKAIKLAKKYQLPFFILGGGSNVLVDDEGFNGLIIKIIAPKKSLNLLRGNIIEAPAGLPFGALVSFSVKHGLQGLEWAGGLPGTFGGAIRGNAGAFGGETKDVIIKVEALDDQGKLRTFNNLKCQFSYRNSIFKKNNWIILMAKVKLKSGDKGVLEKIRLSRLEYRKKNHPLEYPSAGSVFKNIDVKALSQKFQEEFADKVKQDPFPIVPAAWFIIGAGLTGKRIGGAQISTKHSNYIVNRGNATAKNILDLIALAQKTIKEKYNIELEPEVQYVK